MSAPDLSVRFNENGTVATKTDATSATKTATYTLFDLEKKVIDALNDFNEKYAIYLRCSEDIYDINSVNYNIKYDGKKGCETASKNKSVNASAAQEAYNTLNTRIEALNLAMDLLKTSSGGITPQEYNDKYSTLLTKHEEIIKMRDDMESKMRDIESVDNIEKRKQNPRVQDIFMYHDTTLYSTMMLTVLATSLLYFAFMKMK